MKTTYPFRVTFRRRYTNGTPRTLERFYKKDGTEVLKLVYSSIYYDDLRDCMHFTTEAKANEYIERKRKAGTAGYFKLEHGSFEVEEIYL